MYSTCSVDYRVRVASILVECSFVMPPTIMKGAIYALLLSVRLSVRRVHSESINQSINQSEKIKVTKVTNVTARPLLQC